MNLEALKYDDRLLGFFGLHGCIRLPKGIPLSDKTVYGALHSRLLTGVPITDCPGDQSSAVAAHHLRGTRAYC